MKFISKLNDTISFIKDKSKIIGMVIQTEEALLFMTPTACKVYDNMDDLQKTIGKLTDKPRTKPSVITQFTLNDFPIKHANAKENNNESSDLITYVVNGNKTVFCAGFFVLRFNRSKSFQVVWCPKLLTLEEHVSNKLPYKTRFEAQQEMRILNSKEDTNHE